VHIAGAGITAAFGIYLVLGDIIVCATFANTAYEALRDYVFAVIRCSS
jgi:hypothetical protein